MGGKKGGKNGGKGGNNGKGGKGGPQKGGKGGPYDSPRELPRPIVFNPDYSGRSLAAPAGPSSSGNRRLVSDFYVVHSERDGHDEHTHARLANRSARASQMTALNDGTARGAENTHGGEM